MRAASKPAPDGLTRLFKRMFILPASLLRRRHCIGWALAFLIVVAGTGHWAGAALQQAESNPALDVLNAERSRMLVGPVSGNAALNEVAERYLATILENRDLTPPVHNPHQPRILSEDVSRAMGPDGLSYRYVGIMVSYGTDARHAMAAGLGSTANRPAMIDPVFEVVGIATAVIPEGSPWFAPPPGGSGRELNLTGQTVVVVVTAGRYRV